MCVRGVVWMRECVCACVYMCVFVSLRVRVSVFVCFSVCTCVRGSDVRAIGSCQEDLPCLA